MRNRAAWLATPGFLAAVGLLALNDHVLKRVGPGWLTGKLSDFAGVLVVATLAAVVVGRTSGVVLTAVAFAALKLLPGVAELAAPVLGGVTLRDASDLVALAVLPALWLWLGRETRPRRARRWLQLAALGAAVLATTASIDRVPPQTQDYLASVVWDRDGAFYVRIDRAADNDLHYVRSTDGGRTWAEAAAPAHGYMATQGPYPNASDPSARALGRVTQQCADDGVCYRTRSLDLNALPDESAWQLRVERRLPGGGWQLETAYGEHDQFGFGGFAVNLADSSQVVALSEDGRILYREGYGDYRVATVLAQPGQPR